VTVLNMFILKSFLFPMSTTLSTSDSNHGNGRQVRYRNFIYKGFGVANKCSVWRAGPRVICPVLFRIGIKTYTNSDTLNHEMSAASVLIRYLKLHLAMSRCTSLWGWKRIKLLCWMWSHWTQLFVSLNSIDICGFR
jgi:hypothetical protein